MKALTLKFVMDAIKSASETTKNLVALVTYSNGINTTVNMSKDAYHIYIEYGILEIAKETGTEWIDLESIVSMSV